MAAPKFLPDQKVFAKVRGHPAWPAKIRAVMDETPNRQKYEVYFYGTRETAVCKYDELFDYLEYREKYGKRIKRRHFAEALSEIEAELNPSERKDDSLNESVDAVTFSSTATSAAPLPTADRDSDDEGNLVIDESPALKAKGKIDPTKTLKRKLSSGGTNDVPEVPPLEITSRSGRKIKPKKFLDEPTEPTTPAASLKNTKPKSVKENNANENGRNRKNGDSEAEAVNGDRVELHWGSTQNVQDLISKSEQVELPKSVKKDLKKSLKRKAEEVKQQKQSYSDNESLELLKIEVQLLDADCRIKASLSLTNAKCDDCLRAMDEILDLKLNALMLKKHPEVVDTVKKLKKYVGNVAQWQLTAEEVEAFEEAARKIRSKADTMYNKFKSLFTIPNGKSFLEVYSSETNLFHQKTNSLSVSELYGLVKEEPTE